MRGELTNNGGENKGEGKIPTIHINIVPHPHSTPQDATVEIWLKQMRKEGFPLIHTDNSNNKVFI